jgi:hypothetical protein
MNKKIIPILLLAGLLASCGSKTSELYPSGAFLGDLLDDFLTGYHQITASSIASTKIFDSASSLYFDGFHENDLVDKSNVVLHEGPKAMYPEIFLYGNGTVTLDATPEHDWSQDLEGQSDASYVGTAFGRTKCLVKCDSSFNNGLLSKLYNGQVYCLGLHAKALVQLKEEGLDASLPKKLVSGDYFLMSFRGGSLFGEARITKIDLTIKFYKGSESYVLTFNDLAEWTDNGGDGDSFFGFKFSDIGIDPAGITGFGISYDNLQDDDLTSATLTEEQKENPNAYWGMLVYEVMFPDSTWN